MVEETEKVSDRDLLILIAQGNVEARVMLDERYTNYCRSLVIDYLQTHCDYGNSYDDFFNAAMVGYCKARTKFHFEKSDGFYPYFKVWAMSEMKVLTEEGKNFFLNESPNKFVSLDLTYNGDGEEMIIAENIGVDDVSILDNIRYNEVIAMITDSSSGLSEIEAVICSSLVLKYTEKEIRDFLNLNYRKYSMYLKSIKEKLGNKFIEIFK